MQDKSSTIWEPVSKEVSRWRILALGLFAQTSSCAFLYGLPLLVPAMRTELGAGLVTAGWLVSAPSIGLLATLILWGAAADAFGERLMMATGLGISGGLVLVAATAELTVPALFICLLLAGASAASVNSASGRVVMGWFGPEERGFAMGLRQTAQPLGVGIAALALPPLAEVWGFRAALLAPAVLALVAALLVGLFVVDPPRPSVSPESGADGAARSASPYRGGAIWRVHVASALLVVPQFAVSAFAPIYLVTALGWSAVAAGWFLAAVQVLGAAGRIGAGYWSDRVGSRMRPMRQLAVASAAVMVLVALGDLSWPALVIVALTLGAVITVCDNGLGFTASAELAGTAWAGRAMGVQNTAQNLAAAATPPALALVIGGGGYALAYAVAAVFPALAIALVPVRVDR